MKYLKHSVLATTFVCVVLGVIIGIQLKSVKRQTETLNTQRASELSVEINRLQEENKRLSAQLEESLAKNEVYENSVAGENQAFQSLREELDTVKNFAGLTEMQGSGVVVTLNDSRKAADGADSDAFLVHAEDVLSVINELNASGAEAISVNGQRLIGTSSIRCAGAIIHVNGVKVAAPFEITAIGDPDVLDSALRFPGGVVDTLSPWGIEIAIKKSDLVTVPAYKQAITFLEATPIKEE